MFWLWTSKNPRPARACAVGDEIVGLDIIPRREGRTCGPGHFGLQVEDIEEAKTRIYVFDPSIRTLKRPPVRPFGAYSAHDPDINIFDLSARVYRCRKTSKQMNSSKQNGVSSISPSEPHMPSDARNFTKKFSRSGKKTKIKLIPIFTSLAGT